MGWKRYTAEQTIRHLRQAEVLSFQERLVSEICGEIWIPENTYNRWREEYVGMGVGQAKRLKELEREKFRLKGGPFLWLDTPASDPYCCLYPISLANCKHRSKLLLDIPSLSLTYHTL